MIDAFLLEMRVEPTLYEYEDLIGICIDLFQGGTETMGSTLCWVLLYLSLHQDVQEKCRQEVCAELCECGPVSKQI